MTHAGLTRRDLILAGGAVVSTAALAGPFARTAIAARSPLRRATYTALLDPRFRIRRGGAARTISLRKITDLPRAATLVVDRLYGVTA